MRKELEKKVDAAIKLIQSASRMADSVGQLLEVAYSGGKDSDVILELTKMADVPFRAIYKQTTIDPPGTLAHVRKMGAEIRKPKYNFFELIAKNGFPNRFRRFCCGSLKEYKISDYVVIGIRRDESTKRAERYKEPENCRVFSKKEKQREYMPILYWTLQDVEEFIKERNIKCASVYYDENGNFHAERRLGCMCCPMLFKRRIEQFKQYPNMVKAYIRYGQKYRDTHPNTKTTKQYQDVYEWFVRSVFYDNKYNATKKWDALNNGLFDSPNYKQFLEDFFNISLE